MQTVNTLGTLREAVESLRAAGPVALVPTMGALHQGHLTLVREARARGAQVVASIFVNPRQFGPNEDLDAYPRRLAEDSRLLAEEGVAVLWAPDVAEMYPQGFSTNISVTGVSDNFCGASRPGHFDGVATVVCKLFNQVRPDLALFGEKDWQQLAVIRRMTHDLDLTRPHVTTVHGVPIVREADGLAMSSRNAYLSVDQRQSAAALPAAMRDAIAAIHAGAPVSETLGNLHDALLAEGFETVDYAELRDGDTLMPLTSAQGAARLFVAARIGGTRLIDNMAVR